MTYYKVHRFCYHDRGGGSWGLFSPFLYAITVQNVTIIIIIMLFCSYYAQYGQEQYCLLQKVGGPCDNPHNRDELISYHMITRS